MRLTLKCPECGLKELWYEPEERIQNSGPPTTWSQGCPASCICESCDWVAEDVENWSPEQREN